MKKFRKALALMLALCMVIGLVPASLAADDSDGSGAVDGYLYNIVHVDCGRKYFSPESLKKIIDNAAAAGFNQVELYLSDNQGFRFALDDMNTYSLNTIQTGPEMALDGWPDKLTFQAKKSSFLSANYFFVQQYLNGSWQDVLNPDLTTNYATYTCSLNRNATQLRFQTKTGATLTKNYKNIQVTRAHFLEANVSSLNIEAQYGTTTTKTIRVNYSNIQDIVTAEIVSGNDEFRVTPATIGNDCGDYGTIDVQVIYTPTAIASDSETLRIGNDKDGYLNIPITTTVSKRTQNLSWALRDSV
ncbi:MAG: family 20 glycosylhydrolase, partial [Eubacteriales bacterium]